MRTPATAAARAVSPPSLVRSPAVYMVAAAVSSFRGVDNILGEASVRERLAAGATPLRVEADFVTCSQ